MRLVIVSACAALGACSAAPRLSTTLLPAPAVMKSASDVRFTNDGPESVVTEPPCGLAEPVRAGETVRVWLESDTYRCALMTK